MKRKISISAFVLLLVVVALLLSGSWSVHRHSEETTCGICARHINPQAGVIAEVGGVRHHVCCAHCAVTEGFQEHKPVKLIEVTDYSTGRKLDPTKAWYVDGSRVVACEHDMAHMSEAKQTAPSTFDRCSPGTFAFADQTQAKDFAAANGGMVRNMEEMLAGVNAAGEAKQ
jgi:hypothetical protein